MRKLTIFSWGFWGWGTQTPLFVKNADHIEKLRGYKPPIFADVRLRRTGRAVNFKENAFREIVGEKRYYWLRGLGNAAIADDALDEITIKDPEEAKKLLDLAIEANKLGRRIIYFCACEIPAYCHRYDVGNLLFKEAKKRGIALEIVEWPGGKVQQIKEQASDDMIKKIAKGQSHYPLPVDANLKKYAALAWGSIVELSSASWKLRFISGPAKYIKNRWVLPVVKTQYPKNPHGSLKKVSGNYIKDKGYSPRVSAS
jgi:hypothetical protein